MGWGNGAEGLVRGFQQGSLFREQMTEIGQRRKDKAIELSAKKALENQERPGGITDAEGKLYDPYEFSLQGAIKGIGKKLLNSAGWGTESAQMPALRPNAGNPETSTFTQASGGSAISPVAPSAAPGSAAAAATRAAVKPTAEASSGPRMRTAEERRDMEDIAKTYALPMAGTAYEDPTDPGYVPMDVTAVPEYFGQQNYADGGPIAGRRYGWADLQGENAARAASTAAAGAESATKAAYDSRGVLSKVGATLRGRNPNTPILNRAIPAAVLGGSAYEQYGQETEDMREKYGLQTKDPSLAGDIAVRGVNYAETVARNLGGGAIIDAGRRALGVDGEEPTVDPARAQAIEAQGPPEEEKAAAVSAGLRASASEAQSTGRPVPVSVGEPSPEQEAASLGDVDLMPDEMPSMSTRDWVAYRGNVVPELMKLGMSPADAHMQVTNMQQEGFTRYASQAAMMLQANNPAGAARAMKAAYQYFPNGSDVTFGFQKGSLVAMGRDEETGKPKGKPQLITPEYLASMITNFKDPNAYLQWTKDWRDEKFRDTEYNEVTKPSAQADIDYKRDMVGIYQQNAISSSISAKASLQRAIGRYGSGGAGGIKPADFDRSARLFMDTPEIQGLMMAEDGGAEAQQLMAIMAILRRNLSYEEASNPEIASQVMEAYRADDVDGLLDHLGIK